ncbi:porin [Solimicrobium silvestre]|uniref:Gram-negative porin n=1 Tax=Solimicrobium silvestre TaxID=2099400 RepID=A0A2S9H115_9BURK|nr:porin [Solimicrobium silvestre]PRC93658.1 Gram-negative porin [Solimicrobium silvestre]
MNKKIIGLSIAMLFAANGAYAQSSNGSSVELYGVLDAAIGTVNHSLSGDANFPGTVNPISATKIPQTSATGVVTPGVNNSTSGMFNGGISDSRWGIRGSEDLGGGLKAIFTLESGFNLPTGNINNAAASLANNRNGTTGTVSAPSSLNGQLFNRQAFVGLSDAAWGTITLGRNYAPIYDMAVAYDPVQNAQLFSPLGFSGTYGGGGGVTENTRQDNSIKYKNTIGDFRIGAMYKVGGVAGESSAESGYAFFGGYSAAGFSIDAAYQAYTDALKETNSATANDINVTNYDTTSYFVAAKYAFGDATVRAGYESFTLKAPSNGLAALGATTINGYAIGNIPTAAANTADFNAANQTTDILFAGGDYNFTSAFNLAVGFYDIQSKSSSDFTGLSATGAPNKVNGFATQPSGNIYEYSLLADYHFTKRTDVYAGVLYSQYKGDAYSSLIYNTSNYIYAVGLRTKF